MRIKLCAIFRSFTNDKRVDGFHWFAYILMFYLDYLLFLSTEWYTVSITIFGHVDFFDGHISGCRLDDIFKSLYAYDYTKSDQYRR